MTTLYPTHLGDRTVEPTTYDLSNLQIIETKAASKKNTQQSCDITGRHNYDIMMTLQDASLVPRPENKAIQDACS